MRTILTAILLSVICFSGVFAQTSGTATQNSKVLVAFFSRADENYGVGVVEKGNTHILAEMIAAETKGTLFHIKTVKAYPKAYHECTDVAKSEKNSGARPAIVGTLPDLSKYDTIYLGYPIWWGDFPMAVYTFLESYPAGTFKGKTIRPFCTHEGSGIGDTVSHIRKACSGATVGNGLEMTGRTAQNNRKSAQSQVTEWIKKK